jgi:hypothetical protein
VRRIRYCYGYDAFREHHARGRADPWWPADQWGRGRVRPSGLPGVHHRQVVPGNCPGPECRTDRRSTWPSPERHDHSGAYPPRDRHPMQRALSRPAGLEPTSSYVKDPQTGQRLARLNPASAWLVTEVPELRIVGRRALAAGAGPAGLDPRIAAYRQGADGQVLEAPPRPPPADRPGPLRGLRRASGSGRQGLPPCTAARRQRHWLQNYPRGASQREGLALVTCVVTFSWP